MKILIDIPVYEPALQAIKGNEEHDIEVVPYAEEVRPLPVETIQDREVLFCTFPPENIAGMESLELIQIGSAGYTQLLGIGLPEKGVRACNARGVFDTPIAEWSVAMMVNLVRDMRGMIRNQKSGIWDRDARFQREIRELTVGIWGYGGIGRETARLAKAMGMNIHVMVRDRVKPRKNVYMIEGTGDPDGVLPDKVFSAGEEKEFLESLDFLILSMPLTPENEGIIGERELDCLPQTAYLLNPARGPLVKEEALITALGEHRIAGAALDTHYYYPMPQDHPLWSFPHVIMTPHVSGSSKSPHFLERVWDIFCQNVKRYSQGRPLLNELSANDLSAGGFSS
jgi:phosphoglycerate dehydrogenase-like enzyme